MIHKLSTKNEIINWLDSVEIKKCIINDDLTVDVNGEVNLVNKNLTFLPIQFGKVKGDFDCAQNQLSSFDGFPTRISGYFNCYQNQFATLEGMPKVGHDIEVSFNQLISLKGSPKKVKGSFYCQGNLLQTLEGGPQIIEGSFIATKNKLKNLIGCPQEVENKYYLNNNELVSLEGLPLMTHSLDLSDNHLESLDFLPIDINGAIDIQNNPLSLFFKENGEVDLTQFKSIMNIKRCDEFIFPAHFNKIFPNSLPQRISTTQISIVHKKMIDFLKIGYEKAILENNLEHSSAPLNSKKLKI